MGDVRKLFIEGPAGMIEAALRTAARPRASVVLAHPHPLHGGTLHNPVMFHSDRNLNRAGMTTLRFNFRGVGGSAGEHDEGRGELKDIETALGWLRGIAPDVPSLIVGYSFGSWCGLRYAAGDRHVFGFVAIGLPVRKYPFEELRGFARPLHVVQGGQDEFGTPLEVEEILTRLELDGSAKVHEVPGAEHLFPGEASRAGEQVAIAVDEILKGSEPIS